MKQLIIITTIALIHIQSLNAQFFGLRQISPENYYHQILDYPNDSNYRVLNIRYPLSIYNQQKCQILKFNPTLTLKDSTELIKGYYPINNPLKINSKLFWLCSYSDTTQSSLNNNISILELDSSYHYLNSHAITSTNAYNHSTSNLIQIQSRYYLAVNEYSNNNFLNSKIFKLNAQFQELDSLIFNGEIIDFCRAGNNLLINTGGISTSCSIQNSGKQTILKLDTSFAINSCFEASNLSIYSLNGVPNNVDIRYYDSKLISSSSTKFILVGNTYIYYELSKPPITSMVVGIINNNQSIKTTVFTNTVATTGHINRVEGVSIKSNTILTIGCINYNFQSINPIQQKQKTKLIILNMDTLGNLRWNREFGGDMFYLPGNIKLINNDVIVSGLRYDSAYATSIGMTNIGQSFLLKLDVNGNYNALGLTENGKNVSNQIKCFPNPAQQTLFFDVPFEENIEVEIFDLLGRRVLRKENYKNYTAINIEGLVQGAYLYQIKTKTSFYSGKFLKTSD